MVSEKTIENPKRLGQQERPRNEPGTSRLPVLEHSHWWTAMPYPEFEPGTFGVAAGSPNHYTVWSTLFVYELL